jgi:hypothetical protein
VVKQMKEDPSTPDEPEVVLLKLDELTVGRLLHGQLRGMAVATISSITLT